MSDQQELGGQQTGQFANPEAQPSGNGQAADNQAPASTYVTPEQLEARLAEVLKQTTSNAQSLVDKTKNTINAKIESLKSLGISATPEQAAALIESEKGNQSSAQEQTAAKQPVSVAGEVDSEKANWITANTKGAVDPSDPYWGTVYEISKENDGILIGQNDPELEIMNKQFTSGAAFVSAFAQAVAAKKLRTQNDKSGFASVPAAFSSNRQSTSMPTNTPAGYHYDKAFGNHGQ